MTRTSLVALTLLHFVWQGALIHGALVALLRLARPSTANVRYAMGVTALALMAMAPIATMTWLATSLLGSAPTRTFVAAFDGDAAITPSQASPSLAVPREPVTALAPATFVQPVRGAVVAMAPLADPFAWLMPWLVGLWLAGVVVLAIRLLGGWLQIRGL